MLCDIVVMILICKFVGQSIIAAIWTKNRHEKIK